MGEFLAEHYINGVLDLCLSLHMSNTGASDPVPEDFQCEAIERMQAIVDDWQPSLPSAEKFDSCVKELIKTTIAECVESHEN